MDLTAVWALEENISKLEARSIETIQIEAQRGKNIELK